ncbi:MAG: UDP-N-acetylglucosamine 1-carboxyvinyltransferase [Oscillospiraceae bacterium]|nr:UDP-N-acetylglucosamine 1-carboxyvinyltransferase [Oscillospiraceae bacterium]
MTQYVINGGNPLHGTINISGAKNAALAILPATLLAEGECRIENIPQVTDVAVMLDILRGVGASVTQLDDHTVVIDSGGVRAESVAPYEQARRMRASYYLIGAFLARFGAAQVAMPGGCNLGVRPIDQHIKGFEALGADVQVKAGFVHANARGECLSGSNIYLDVQSVGATINIILAAVMADGLTVIENAAREPHVVDMANFLNSMGANIKGAGTDLIKIRGTKRLTGGSYAIIPDQIEAGTYMAAVTSAGGEITINNVIPKHLECITAKLEELGAETEEFDEAVTVRRTGSLRKANIKTLPYPGFPTDMQPQVSACLTFAEGTSMITESISDNRYRYVDELKRMGARVQVDGKVAVIEGIRRLSGAPVQACDLRAGAALIVAALGAQGTTKVGGVFHIERGYEDIVGKLRNVGADIRAEDTNDPNLLANTQTG